MIAKRIVEMMESAHVAGKAVPVIVFETPEGRIKFYRQTEKSKTPGAVSMTDGGPRGEDKWFGKIGVDGDVFFTQLAGAWVKSVVEAFNESPAAFASEYGKGSDQCCFCARAITTDESRAVGYGPVCAENFGLPWGKPISKESEIETNAAIRGALFHENTVQTTAKEVVSDFEDDFGPVGGTSGEDALAAMESADYAEVETRVLAAMNPGPVPWKSHHAPFDIKTAVALIRGAATEEEAVKLMENLVSWDSSRYRK